MDEVHTRVLPGQDQIQDHLLGNPWPSGSPSHNHMHALPRPARILNVVKRQLKGAGPAVWGGL
jgi:hypothetical protein